MLRTANRGNRIRSRLERLNARLGRIMAFYIPNADGKPLTYPTYTQAKKALKAIPREIRQGYEKSLRSEVKTQKEQIAEKQYELRQTDVPTERKKSKKQAREESKKRKEKKEK